MSVNQLFFLVLLGSDFCFHVHLLVNRDVLLNLTVWLGLLPLLPFTFLNLRFDNLKPFAPPLLHHLPPPLDHGDPDGGVVPGGGSAPGAGILHPTADADQGDGCGATVCRRSQDGAFDRATEGETTHPAGV